MDAIVKGIRETQNIILSQQKQSYIKQKIDSIHSSFTTHLQKAIENDKNNENNKNNEIDKKLMDVCIEMESLFVYQMLKAMRNTLQKENDLLYGGFAQDIFEDMLYNEYALKISKNANFGLAKILYEQLQKK